MADCRMVRRNSGEILEASGGVATATNGGGTQVVSGCVRDGGPSTNGGETMATTPPSKSFHRQQQQQQMHQQQCQYYSGFPPPHIHQHHHHHHHPHPQQFVGGGGLEGAFMNGGQPQQLPHQPEQPPPRAWIQVGHPKHKRACFTVLCYNILCSRYATPTLYSYCPGWALDWNYRRKAILQELIHYAPDIILLQEMETDQFYNFFLPQLQLLGYSGIFGAKSRARTMMESKRKLVDGCAIFYRTSKFRLLSEHLIEFSQVAMASAHGKGEEPFSEEMINRVQTKDNIALAALLETKMDSEHVKGLHGLSRPLLVCTCHIHWDPNFCDVKLVQTMMLMQELRKITDSFDFSQPPFASKRTTSSPSTSTTTSSSDSSPLPPSPGSNMEKVNLLVCGDFNSLPQSGVIQFMENGTISCAHPDFKGLSYEGYVGSCTKLSPRDSEACISANANAIPLPPEEFQHGFKLHSVYPPETMPFTNYTLEFQGVIDYIFHSVKGLRPLGLLGPLDTTWLVHNNIVGAPHPCIPSDHLPLLVELEMIPAI